jgi:hypothetical protein
MNYLGIVLPMPERLRGWAKRTAAIFLIQEALAMEGEFLNNMEK